MELSVLKAAPQFYFRGMWGAALWTSRPGTPAGRSLRIESSWGVASWCKRAFKTQSLQNCLSASFALSCASWLLVVLLNPFVKRPLCFLSLAQTHHFPLCPSLPSRPPPQLMSLWDPASLKTQGKPVSWFSHWSLDADLKYFMGISSRSVQTG